MSFSNALLVCLLFLAVQGLSSNELAFQCDQVSLDLCGKLIDFKTLPAYGTNSTVGTPFTIDDRDFSFSFVANPLAYQYSILISKETSGVNQNQFRLELHNDGFVALFGLGVGQSNEPTRQISRDPSNWYSMLTSNQPLPLNAWTHIKVQRKEQNISLYFNDMNVAEYQTTSVVNHHNSVDLRVGSRYPPSGSSPDHPFYGDIAKITLHSSSV